MVIALTIKVDRQSAIVFTNLKECRYCNETQKEFRYLMLGLLLNFKLF